MFLLRLFILICSTALLVSCTPLIIPEDATPPSISPLEPVAPLAPPTVLPTPTLDVEEGIALYRAMYCGACHTFTLAAAKGIFAPSHDNMRATATAHLQSPAYSGNATTVEEYVLESIVEPDIYLVEGFSRGRNKMPSYVHLAQDELITLVQLLLYE